MDAGGPTSETNEETCEPVRTSFSDQQSHIIAAHPILSNTIYKHELIVKHKYPTPRPSCSWPPIFLEVEKFIRII